MSEALFAAGLCAARLDPPSPALVARARPAVAAALAGSVRLPPLGLVADVAALLQDASPRLARTALPGLDLRRYDDRIVGPLVGHRRRTALADAYAALPSSWRGAAVAALSERMCEALEPEGAGWWEPAAVRAWLARTDAEAWQVCVAGLADPEIRGALGARVGEMLGRPPMDWSPADVHLVEHLPALATRAQRLLVRQVLEAATAFDLALPRTVRPRVRSGPVLAAGLAEEDTYPAGGFSSLTTSGSPENLVASELVYMDDVQSSGGIDLFDMRFAEGELLYYTRDDSAHTRRRRRIHVGLSSDLRSARIKDPGHAWQRGVLVLGALHALVERVVRWLGEAELRIVFHPIQSGAGPSGLDDEVSALSLVLGAWVEAGIAAVEPLPRPEAMADKVLDACVGAEVDTVWVSVAEPAPKLIVPPFTVDVAARPMAGWTQLIGALAAHLG